MSKLETKNGNITKSRNFRNVDSGKVSFWCSVLATKSHSACDNHQCGCECHLN